MSPASVAHAAASGHGLNGAVGFYGHPGTVLERVPSIECPVLALQAGGDVRITPYWKEWGEKRPAAVEALQKVRAAVGR